MNPLITNLLAENRYNERNLAAHRATARTRQLIAQRAASDGDAPALALSLTLPGMGVRRPQWWAAFEAGDVLPAADEPLPVVDACCD